MVKNLNFFIVLFTFFAGMLLLSFFLVYPICETTKFCLFLSLVNFAYSFAFIYSFKN